MLTNALRVSAARKVLVIAAPAPLVRAMLRLTCFKAPPSSYWYVVASPILLVREVMRFDPSYPKVVASSSGSVIELTFDPVCATRTVRNTDALGALMLSSIDAEYQN